MTLLEAINIAKAEVKDPYAIAILNAIPEVIKLSKSDAIHAMQVQLLYALSNMNNWRGTRAREVKKKINEFCKTKF